jgi:hypothetical protein
VIIVYRYIHIALSTRTHRKRVCMFNLTANTIVVITALTSQPASRPVRWAKIVFFYFDKHDYFTLMIVTVLVYHAVITGFADRVGWQCLRPLRVRLDSLSEKRVLIFRLILVMHPFSNPFIISFLYYFFLPLDLRLSCSSSCVVSVICQNYSPMSESRSEKHTVIWKHK